MSTNVKAFVYTVLFFVGFAAVVAAAVLVARYSPQLFLELFAAGVGVALFYAAFLTVKDGIEEQQKQKERRERFK